jgi:hypothetical protein
MIIGRVNNEPIQIGTNLKELTPASALAILLPVLDSRNATKITIPYNPPIEMSFGNGLEYFCDFIKSGQNENLGFHIEWGNKVPYSIPDADDTVALRIDNLLSVLAYHMFKKTDIKISPYIISYSKEDHDDKLSWAKSVGIKPSDIILNYVKYGNNLPEDMDKYNNWLFSSIAVTNHNNVWIPVPRPEINDYIPGQYFRMFNEGSKWLTSSVGRSARIDSPFAENKTRTEIVKESMDRFKLDDNFIKKAIRCRCGKCFECFMNFSMLNNLEILHKEEVFPDGFKNPDLKKRLSKMAEMGKISQPLTNEIILYLN